MPPKPDSGFSFFKRFLPAFLGWIQQMPSAVFNRVVARFRQRNGGLEPFALPHARTTPQTAKGKAAALPT